MDLDESEILYSLYNFAIKLGLIFYLQSSLQIRAHPLLFLRLIYFFFVQNYSQLLSIHYS